MLKEKLLNFMNYYYFIENYYIYHILFLYIFFLRITYTYAEITISHFFTFLLNKYENIESSKEEENFFYYFTHFFNFNNKNDDKFLNTKLFVVVYLPICLKCFYTLFFDYIAYYVYIRYYLEKINNNFKKIYYSSTSYEKESNDINENLFYKRNKDGFSRRISKRKKSVNDICVKRLSDMSLYQCRKYMIRKNKTYSIWQRKKKLKLDKRKHRKSTTKKSTCKEEAKKKNVRIKFITCRNSFIKNNLLRKDIRCPHGNKLFHNIFENKRNIFFRRKQKKRNKIEIRNFSPISPTDERIKRKNEKCTLNKLYSNIQNKYNFDGNISHGEKIIDSMICNNTLDSINETERDKDMCINKRVQNFSEHMNYDTSIVEINSCTPNSLTGCSNEEELQLLKFRLEKKETRNYVKLGDEKNDTITSDFASYFENRNVDYSEFNASTPHEYNNENRNYEEIHFKNFNENMMCISKTLGYYDYEDTEKCNHCNGHENSSIQKDSQSLAIVDNMGSTNKDTKRENVNNPYDKEKKIKKSYKTLRGSLKMGYLFKDSCDLTENNMGSGENNDYYYYYNKFKNFNYGKRDNSHNVRELINNRINAEYYHLKLNILILSCIIIQVFNACILILISNNFIRKKEQIFFFCFLYSLLESVTDVISENIFFLCGKLTNIYKKEFSLNAIYVIQVISKMILSLSTIFIYFIYHIFVILYEQVNIMIINTFIKTLSIFILSFIFLKNKDNIFNYDDIKQFENVTCKKQEKFGRIIELSKINCKENGSVKINIKEGGGTGNCYKSEDKTKNSSSDDEEVNYNVKKDATKVNSNDNLCIKNTDFDRGIFSNTLYNDKYYGDYFNFSKNTYFNEKLLNNEFVLNESTKKGQYVNPFCVISKHIAESLNFFKILSRLKNYILKKENNINYNHNYTLLTVHDSKCDERNTSIFFRNKREHKIVIPLLGGIKNFFNISDRFSFYSGIQNSGIAKYNSIIEKDVAYLNRKKKKKLLNSGQLKEDIYNINNMNSISSLSSMNSLRREKKKNIIISYPIKLLLNNLNFSNIFYICLLLIIPTFDRIFLNYKIKNITLDLHCYCYLNFASYVTDLVGLYLYISYFNEESYASSIFLSSLINIFLMSFRVFFLHNGFNHICLLFLETILKSLHKTFFYMPIYILVTKVYIKNIHNLMCSFYSSILDASSFASYYFEYLILSYYNIEDSRNVFILVYIIFLVLHLSSLIVISKLKKT
ncbi:hypothetical protein, conserved [Plasmodium gonderi]|uniref:Uncharacterized protein n=1 Tax=Plasmodium gonderi TaxID=77519 RepID=A0A1Y1JHX2_PLAGO|nr:hypothetical protein, conserved [Plasmodium gonderi]GAW81258.1 hypothetical protein, conserved [Plasmodium gonderi]